MTSSSEVELLRRVVAELELRFPSKFTTNWTAVPSRPGVEVLELIPAREGAASVGIACFVDKVYLSLGGILEIESAEAGSAEDAEAWALDAISNLAIYGMARIGYRSGSSLGSERSETVTPAAVTDLQDALVENDAVVLEQWQPW